MSWPHTIVLPIVLPLMTGAALLLLERRAARLLPWISIGSALGGLLVAVTLLMQAQSGVVQAYLLGNWAASFGIALALDRLAAMLLLLTAMVGLVALLYASGGDAARGRHFHSLMQFQLMGLNGAFLTADLFNLFVFFEVLLMASYGLLLHGGGAARLRAATHYVSFNLAGSALFLIAVSLLYGLTGTLNMADLAQRVPQVAADRTQLVQSAALLLIVVFGIKAALLPLYFWLPATYGAATGSVAAMFAIMTKVGVYAILRVTTLIFGESGGVAAHIASPWLQALALGTLLLGAVGALAAQNLRALIGNAVIASAGTLLLAVGLGRADTVAAGLFYLVDSTLVVAALFLLADRIRLARGVTADQLVAGNLGAARISLSLLFFVFAAALAGLPPLSGFLGKAMLLQAAGQTAWAGSIVAVVLASSFLMLVALSRAGSVLFWLPATATASSTMSVPTNVTVAASGWHLGQRAAVAGLLLLIICCAVFAGPLSRLTAATAEQLFERNAYLQAVLGAQPLPAAWDVRQEMRERKAQGEEAGP